MAIQHRLTVAFVALIAVVVAGLTLPPADPVDTPPPLPVPLVPLRQALNGENKAIAVVEASHGGRMLAVFIPPPADAGGDTR
ncbi:MAG: hypothetical protein ACRDZO_22830 [Egibacteraceae bacterium]